MDTESRLSLSFYKTISTIDDAHKIYVVEHIQSHKIFVKKILDIYNKDIYSYLCQNPIPHTPKIYEMFEEEQNLIIIEEYISGDTIEDLLENNTHISNEQIRTIFLKLCTIVSQMHQCTPAVIHRDIKPSNVMITPSGEVFLLDFNAAKYVSYEKEEDTRLLGTKGYAAPEQYGFGVSTVQTDIYALGMLLNTMVIGTFSSDICRDIEFRPIVSTCTKLNPEDRYKDVITIIKRLQKYDSIPQPKERKPLPDGCSYLPPGYRSLSPFIMFFSSVGYLFLFWLCLTLTVKDSTPHGIIVERVFTLLMFLTIIFCSGNYRNVLRYFPLCKTNNILFRLAGILILDVLIFFSFMVLMIFLSSIV